LPVQGSKRQFIEEVFPGEIEEIKRIRRRRGNDTANLKGAPSTEQGLVGLALSGGGIRSASFSLGVIQALEKYGILKSVDYLSTVSGGGFIGTCLSSLLNTNIDLQAEKSPFRHKLGVEESETMRHLRNSSRYLAPGGFIDKLRLPTMLLRGIIINFCVLLAFIMLVAVPLTEIVFELKHFVVSFYNNILFLASWGFFLILALIYPFIFRVFFKKFNWRRRNAYEILLSISLVIPLTLVVLAAVSPVVSLAIGLSWGEVQDWLLSQAPLQVKDYWIWLVTIAVAIIFMFAGMASEKISKWTGKIILYLTGLIGPAILFLCYLLMCVLQIDSPFIDKKFRHLESPSARQEFNRELASELDNGMISQNLRQVLEDRGTPEDAAIKIRKKGVWWEITDKDDKEPYYTIRKYKNRLRIHEPDFWDGYYDVGYLAVLFFLLLLLYFVDVNVTSSSVFYRDRLSKAYLIKIDENSDIEHRDGQKLSDLAQQGTAPYHLINAALNMQGSKDPRLFERVADFFIFSKRFVGSYSTGFCKTEDMEKFDRYVNLGTAMAISGAAVAPNRGYTTVKPLVFILTMLNIRLNYWLPNPSAVNRPSWFKKILMRLPVSPVYLWKEAIGRVHAKGTYVNLSDGGHIENLGIYELLRRHCKYIIAVDAGTDKSFEFSSLVKLIRFARIDMGVDIEIELNDLRQDTDGFNHNHWAIGKIQYSESEIGHLLYIKASITGDENEYIREYRSRNPAFPHQPLTYQFFDETQFEAYRALGYHITNKMLGEISEMTEFKLFA
jgi:hypothetical protein